MAEIDFQDATLDASPIENATVQKIVRVRHVNVFPVTSSGDGDERKFQKGTTWYTGALIAIGQQGWRLDFAESGTLSVTLPTGTVETYDVILMNVEDTGSWDQGGRNIIRAQWIGTITAS